MGVRAPVVVGLYVPGDRPERFEKAFAAGADQVVVDLEDAVSADRKRFAREAVADLLRGPLPGLVAVRPNGRGTPWHDADLQMLAASPHRPAVRFPKVESPDDVAQCLARFGDGDIEVTCLVESALGVERAFDIARHPGVAAVALGEADLRAQLGIIAEDGLDWLRVRLVVAAAAAGLDPPQMAAYTGLDDPVGLTASCQHGAALGMLGRTAVHPRQVPLIRQAFTPTAEEVERAEDVLSVLAAGAGAARLADGRMVDAAMAAQARRTLRIRELIVGTSPG